jgi:adenosylmethionine-8-amino-7-oxononanoate aminotransferase
MLKALLPLAALSHVKDIRVLGAIGVVELKQVVNLATFQAECVRRGIWVRPFGCLVYVMPPYSISHDELAQLLTQLKEMITHLEWAACAI